VMTKATRCIGMPGENYAVQRERERERERERVVWGSEIFTPLTLQCWLNRSGDLLLIDICYVQSCLVLNIILMVIY
jgi:hypothetical protein